MRIVSLLSALAVSFPALADQISAGNRITAVTLYPQGAMISREVVFSAPVGAHQVLLPDMPADTYAEALRVSGDEGARPGAVWLRDALPPLAEVLTPEQLAAKAVLAAAEVQVGLAADAVALAQAEIEAANAQIAFLSGLRPEGDALTPDAVRALSATVAAGIVAARERAIDAGAQARPLQLTLAETITARDRAQAAYDALPVPEEDRIAVAIAVDVATEGDHRLIVTQMIDAAGWAPVYDLTLQRKLGTLTLARGAMVAQYTGEDWTGVALTLSTARPSERSDASILYPEYREIYDPEAELEARKAGGEMEMMADAVVAAAPEASFAMPELQGDVLTYVLPDPVDVAAGVENLRLALDEIALSPKVQARAVPRYDTVAYLTAEFVNDSGEILLPGQVWLYSDSNLVGQAQLPLLAAGDKAVQGFGAIDGLVLERTMPERATGDRGIILTETEQSERAVLTVKNLTEETWPVRMLDQVPYSEQDDLDVTFAANPAPDEVDVDAQRGILAWEFDVAPGAEQTVEIEHALSWPSGMALR